MKKFLLYLFPSFQQDEQTAEKKTPLIYTLSVYGIIVNVFVSLKRVLKYSRLQAIECTLFVAFYMMLFMTGGDAFDNFGRFL